MKKSFEIQNQNALIFRDPITTVIVAIAIVIVVGVMSCQNSACTSSCVH